MKKINFIKIVKLFKMAFKKWWNRDPFNESAIIAYNAIFSLPGLLVVVITIAGYFLGNDAISGNFHNEVEQVMGTDTANQIQNIVMIANKSKDSVWATIMGVAIILIGATGVFVKLQNSFNTIWEFKTSKSKSGILSFLKSRLFSFGLIISIAFLLLMSLVLSSLLSAFGIWVTNYWSESLLVVFKILNGIFSVIIITILFALMFKFLPDAKIKWRSVWIGAFVTSLLFVLGKSALGLYFGKADPASGYGAAGSLVLILLWTSYTSMIVFYGAEFTKVYSDQYYGETAPSVNSVSLSNIESKTN